MAFPTIVNTAESSTPTASTSHIVNLPASLVSGNLIVILGTIGSVSATYNTLSGWTELVDENMALGITVWARQSTGSEGATVTFTSTANTRSAEISYQISGAELLATQAPQLSTVATGSSTSPNATTCTPTGGAKDYLWISFFNLAGEEADDDTWVTAAPTSFTGLLQKACGVAGSNLGGLIASASRQFNAASLDAAAFTTVTSPLNVWRAYTLAVHPAASVSDTASPAVIARSVALGAVTPQAGSTTTPALIASTVTVDTVTPLAGSVVSPTVTALAVSLPAVTAGAPPPPVIQEGFRWRNDDGSETTATWLETQDVDTDLALDTPVRLRVLLDTTEAVDPTAYTLYYKKSSDSTWEPVPVGAGGASTLLTDNFTGTNGAAWNSTNWPTQRDGTVDIQSNAGRLTGGRVLAFTAISVTDFEMLLKRSGPGMGNYPEIGYRIGSNIASGSPDNGYALQGTGGGGLTLYKINGYSTVASGSASWGATPHTAWYRLRIVGSNHKIRWWADGGSEPGTWDIDATDSTYTSGPIMLGKWSGSDDMLHDDLTVTDPAGAPNPVDVATSANVTASGEDTTAQLTAPSGKTTADFVTGRMWDDENGTDTIEIG